jgi:hypothetical protein
MSNLNTPTEDAAQAVFGLPENACSLTDPSRGSHISIPKNASRKKPNMNTTSLRP